MLCYAELPSAKRCRDLASRNILLGPRCEAVVSDFGADFAVLCANTFVGFARVVETNIDQQRTSSMSHVSCLSSHISPLAHIASEHRTDQVDGTREPA